MKNTADERKRQFLAAAVPKGENQHVDHLPRISQIPSAEVLLAEHVSHLYKMGGKLISFLDLGKALFSPKKTPPVPVRIVEEERELIAQFSRSCGREEKASNEPLSTG